MQTQLPFFAIIEVSGEDRHIFLHNQLSNDIQNLAPQQACYATYNTPKGRVVANMIVVNTGEQILLALAADLAEKVIKRLRMFILRAKVKLDLLADWGVSGHLNHQASALLPTEPHLVLPVQNQKEIILPHGGILTIAPKNTLPPYNPEAEIMWQTHEINSGYPWISLATTETCVAQMLNQHIIGGVHFRKGCYPGQEIIARAQYRGQVKRGLATATSQSINCAGDIVQTNDGAEVGIVINVAKHLNLLVIKHAAATQSIQNASQQPFDLQHLFFSLNEKVTE